jgi:hypothetical protein
MRDAGQRDSAAPKWPESREVAGEPMPPPKRRRTNPPKTLTATSGARSPRRVRER